MWRVRKSRDINSGINRSREVIQELRGFISSTNNDLLIWK
jgi:hypothetical protein